MATEHDTTRDSTATAASPRNAQVVEFEEFIEAQLSKTRGHVRSVDIAGSLMLLAAGTLGLLLVAVIFDHWIVSGGLGFWGRALFLAVFVIGATTFLATQVLPLLVRKINPLYAAQTIERSQPTLKNALVNFLFFRADRSGVNPVVYEAVEEQAATGLAGAHADAAVDRSKLIHVGYVLLGILLVCAVYAIVSPKDLFQTAGRIAMPWAEISAPTQTRITEVVPGAAQAFRGQQVAVSAQIHGLAEGDKAVLYYSTDDGQIVDRAVALAPPAEGYKYACGLPGGEASLQQDVTYRIEAGDAISPEYRITVVAAPTIFVRSLEYKYPSYTGLVSQRVEREGDIKAIEGTEITLDALANGEIQTAYVDFACDGKPDLRMRADGDLAKVSFRLKLNEDRASAEHPSYQVTFTNAAGQQNPQPVQHQIEVTRDLSPEIEFIAPRQEEMDLPLNGELEWEVVANDPDFKLGLVKLSATRGKQPLFDKLLLSEPHRGQFVAKFKFQPEKLGLKAGDVVEYSALAEDNKSPGPNRTETAKRRVRIISPDASGEQQDRLAQNDRGGQGKRQPGERGQGKGEQPQQDQPADGQQGKQDQAGKNDPANGQQSKSDQQDEQDPGDDQKSGDKGKQGDAKSKSGKQGDGQQDGGKQDGGKPGEGQQQGQAGDDGQPGGNDGQPQDGQGQDEKQPAADEPVPSDGSNDGDAIERILKHREQQEQAGKQGAGDKQKNERPGESPQQQNEQAASPDEKSDQPRNGADQGSEKQAGKGDQQQQQSPADAQQKRSDDGARGQAADGSKQQGGSDGAQDKGTDGQGAKDNQPQGAGNKKQQHGQGKSPGGKQSADKQPGEQQAGEKSSQPGGDNAGEGAKPAADDAQSGDQKGRPGDEAQGGEKPMKRQDRPAGDSVANGTADKKQPGDKPRQGDGAQSKDDPTAKNKPDKPGEQQAGDKQRPDAKGGDGNRDKGKSGAGQQSQDKQGSPSPEDANQPRDKAAGAEKPDSDPKDPNQAQSPSNSKRESDSQGQDDGDRSGGGKRGGGQKANKPGTGGAGENTAADDGNGAAEEAGDGETSDRAGDDKASSKPTGKSGSQQGQGSEKQAGDSKNGESGAAESAAGQPANESAAGKDSSEQGAPGGAPTGGKPNGKPPAQTPAEAPYRSGPEVEDKANLEYARRASDLAISHLKDELAKDQPDPELLDKLGWTRDDLENFIKRWDEMRQNSQAPDERGQASRRELDDTLRSLGLRPRATSLRANDARNDKVRGLRESRSTAPPPEYAEQTKAYTQGTARGEK